MYKKPLLALMLLPFFLGNAALAQSSMATNDWFIEQYDEAFDHLSDDNGPKARVHLTQIVRFEDEQPRWTRKALHLLSELYVSDSFGIKADRFEQMKWLRRSAAQGYSPAMLDLGKEYQTGLGAVGKDIDVALIWYQRAAEAGSAEAIVEMGLIFAWGFDLEQDVGRAERLLLAAGERGHSEAFASLAYFHSHGANPELWPELSNWQQDLPLALKLYRRASDLGSIQGAQGIVRVCALIAAPPAC